MSLSSQHILVKMPEQTEVLNKPAAEAEAEKNDASGTESDSDDSIPELEDAGAAGANAQTQVKQTFYSRAFIVAILKIEPFDYVTTIQPLWILVALFAAE